ncbi:hypothetical protein QBC40DRAFT_345336 [Triangularia verruculosa]|uniref:Uncharacterized protein n=1 Tax=Triangularia verruculosa TaxID=2587418 RepID=A0AAN6XPS4_9PEZI|nr:hypothetical protein QBC40DRAFT_345336 [Triangularia verruculosa]
MLPNVPTKLMHCLEITRAPNSGMAEEVISRFSQVRHIFNTISVTRVYCWKQRDMSRTPSRTSSPAPRAPSRNSSIDAQRGSTITTATATSNTAQRGSTSTIGGRTASPARQSTVTQSTLSSGFGDYGPGGILAYTQAQAGPSGTASRPGSSNGSRPGSSSGGPSGKGVSSADFSMMSNAASASAQKRAQLARERAAREARERAAEEERIRNAAGSDLVMRGRTAQSSRDKSNRKDSSSSRTRRWWCPEAAREVNSCPSVGKRLSTMERPTRRPPGPLGLERSHPTDLGSSSSGPKQSATVSITAELEAEQQQRLEAEATAERVRQAIERILQRGPLSEERMEELSIAAEEFYRQSMERRRKQQQKELALFVGTCLALFGGWMLWRKHF